MKLSYYFKDKTKKWIAGAYTAGITGVYTEPIYLMVYLSRQFVHKRIHKSRFLVFLSILAVHGLTMSYFTGYSTMKLFQQLALLFVVGFGYIQLFRSSKVKLENWFGMYLQFSYWLSILGLIQFGIKLALDINIFPYTLDLLKTQDSLRLKSILLEPGHLALFLMPAISYIIISKRFFFSNKYRCALILIASLLTFSSSMYVGILIALMYRFYDRIKKLKIVFYLVGIVLLYHVFSADYSDTEYQEGAGIKNASQKVAQTADALSLLMSADSSPDYFEAFNASTYASLTNMWVAINAPYRLIGTGLGTHEQNYGALYYSDYYLYGLNREDGYSLFVRLFSEFGFIGIVLYIGCAIMCYNKKNILSICFLIFILSAMIKGGHYTLNCIALFHLLYYNCKNRMVNENLIIDCLVNKKHGERNIDHNSNL